ncbi:MAG TPA: hypothetical protein VD997_07005 [Phycisphaerales bacterium]|nr:hypothetical protein [Phycisphaerales bacterium]
MLRSLTLFAALLAAPVLAQPTNTSITFQGRLTNGGASANGLHDIRVTPYDAQAGGAALAATTCIDNVEVTDGLFTVTLPNAPFGKTAGAYLEVQVRADPTGLVGCATTSGYTTLTPRQPVTTAPTAAYALAFPSRTQNLPGAVRYNAENGRFEGYNGAYWAPFQMGEGLPPPNQQDFTTPGTSTFVVPEGVSSIGADIWGGGGGGGGVRTDGNLATSCQFPNYPYRGGGGGGGGGMYARITFPVTPGETLTLVVGAGGQASTTAPGQHGGPSTISRTGNIIFMAPGGTGGFVGQLHNQSYFVSPPGPASGAGGQGGNGPLMHPSVSLLSIENGATGGNGIALLCNQVGTTMMPAGGNFGEGRTAGTPLGTMSAGRGGLGTTPSNLLNSAGTAGAIRLFWN